MAYEALTYLPTPDTLPKVGPGFSTQALTQNTPGMTHELNDGSSIGVEFNGSFWTINISYPEFTEEEALPLEAFFNTIRGAFKSFYVSLPRRTFPSAGLWANNILQLSVSETDDSILHISNWGAQASRGTISINDCLKINTGNKIYVVSDVTLDGDVLKVQLSSPIVNKATVPVSALLAEENNNIKFKVRLTSGMPVFTLTSEGVYNGFSISMRENIR